jgi:hypothetical protein
VPCEDGVGLGLQDGRRAEGGGAWRVTSGTTHPAIMWTHHLKRRW